MYLKNLVKIAVLLAGFLLLMMGCSGSNTKQEEIIKTKKELTLATTTSTQDSGLLNQLIPAFEEKTTIKVKVIAVGSGAAMEMGRKGDADVLLVHSRKDEDQFVAEGFGENRNDVMHNEFFLVGPPNDPGQIANLKDPLEALKQIAATNSLFITRGDQSGTHKKEMKLWEKAGIIPQGAWYINTGQGMGETLNQASEKGAYTLSDSATFLAMKDKVNLTIMLRGDKTLANPYGVIAVSKAKFPQIHYDEALAFINFITSDEGQNIIKNFGVDKYGEPLFIPDATK